MSRFNYLIESVTAANFSDTPFRHVEIKNFLRDSDFDEIISANELSIEANDDRELCDLLLKEGYRVIVFPGGVTDIDRYIEWHKSKRQDTSASVHGTI